MSVMTDYHLFRILYKYTTNISNVEIGTQTQAVSAHYSAKPHKEET